MQVSFSENATLGCERLIFSVFAQWWLGWISNCSFFSVTWDWSPARLHSCSCHELGPAGVTRCRVSTFYETKSLDTQRFKTTKVSSIPISFLSFDKFRSTVSLLFLGCCCWKFKVSGCILRGGNYSIFVFLSVLAELICQGRQLFLFFPLFMTWVNCRSKFLLIRIDPILEWLCQ